MTASAPAPEMVIYTCEGCDQREIADTAFEADKPKGFYLQLQQVTGERYTHHAKTPAPVYFCSKECLVSGVQFGISRMVVATEPIGLDPSKKSPW